MTIPNVVLLYPILWISIFIISSKLLRRMGFGERKRLFVISIMVALVGAHVVMRWDSYWGAYIYLSKKCSGSERFDGFVNQKYKGVIFEPDPSGRWGGADGDLESLAFNYWSYLYANDDQREKKWIDISVVSSVFVVPSNFDYSGTDGNVTVKHNGKPVPLGFYRARPARAPLHIDKRGKITCSGRWIGTRKYLDHSARCFKIEVEKINKPLADVLVKYSLGSCEKFEGKFRVCRSGYEIKRVADGKTIYRYHKYTYSGGWLDKSIFDGKGARPYKRMVWSCVAGPAAKDRINGLEDLMRNFDRH